MNNNAKHFEDFLRDYTLIRRKLPRMFGIEIVNLFKENFDKEGFIDKPFRKWKKSAFNNGKTLTKTRRLRKGIHLKTVQQKKVVISVDSNIKYAKIHNEGGKIEITPKMRRLFWAKFSETGDERYKWMALTKKKHIEIPQRQFIGNSKAIPIRLDRRAIKELRKLTNKYS